MALLYDYYTRPAFGASLDQKPDPNAQRVLLDGTEQFPDPTSNPWSPSWYDGLGSAFLLGVGRGLLGTGASVMEVGSGALAGLNDNVWAEQAAEHAKNLRKERNSYKLDERTTSEFSNIVSGVVEGLTGAAMVLPAAGAATALGGGPVAAGATAAALYGLQTGVDTFATNRDEGVDKGTAAQMGITSGIVNAIGMALPPALGGSRLASTAYGVLSNTGLGAAERATYQTLLRDHGYETRAQQYDPTDPTSLIVEGIMGGAFGALGFRKPKGDIEPIIGAENLSAEDFRPAEETPAAKPEGGKGQESKKPEEKKVMTQEQTDAVRVLEVEAANKENLPVNDAEDPQSVTRATNAQQEVHDQINNKEPVDVSPDAADAEKVEALHKNVRKKIYDELKKEGPRIESEPEADVKARVDAQAPKWEEPGFGADPNNPMQVVRDAPVITYADEIPWSQQFRAKPGSGDSFIVIADSGGNKTLHIGIVEADEVISKYAEDGTNNPFWLYDMDYFCSVDGHEKVVALQNMYRANAGNTYRRELRSWWSTMCDKVDMATFDRMEHPILVTVMDSIDFEHSSLNPRYRPEAAEVRHAEAKAAEETPATMEPAEATPPAAEPAEANPAADNPAREKKGRLWSSPPPALGKPARKKKTKEELAKERAQREMEEAERAYEDEVARMPRPIKRILEPKTFPKGEGKRGFVEFFVGNDGNPELGRLPKNVPGVESRPIVVDYAAYKRAHRSGEKELQRAGYPEAVVAMDDLIQTYTKIYKGAKPDSVVLRKTLPNLRVLYGILYVGPKYATFGRVWVSDRPSYTKNKPLLWTRERQPVPGGSEPEDWYNVHPGEAIPPRQQPGQPIAPLPEDPRERYLEIMARAGRHEIDPRRFSRAWETPSREDVVQEPRATVAGQPEAPVTEAPAQEVVRAPAPEQPVASQPEASVAEAPTQEAAAAQQEAPAETTPEAPLREGPQAAEAPEAPEQQQQQARQTPANVDPALDAKAVSVMEANPDIQILDPETGQMMSAKDLMAREDAIAKEVEDIADIGLQVAEVCAFSNNGLRDNTNG